MGGFLFLSLYLRFKRFDLPFEIKYHQFVIYSPNDRFCSNP